MLNVDTYRELKKKILINECGDDMLNIPDIFLRFNPHTYEQLGAPYGSRSPFYLRSGVIDKLYLAQKKLQSFNGKYKLKIFDAYRPLSVQKFMIAYDTKRYSKEIASKFWSPISDSIDLNPPPHSTGGALDLTIVDENELELDMGTKIDEFCEASKSGFEELSSTCRDNRYLLFKVMSFAGFTQLPTEWWHFSYGDQVWALDYNENHPLHVEAKYGAI